MIQFVKYVSQRALNASEKAFRAVLLVMTDFSYSMASVWRFVQMDIMEMPMMVAARYVI